SDDFSEDSSSGISSYDGHNHPKNNQIFAYTKPDNSEKIADLMKLDLESLLTGLGYNGGAVVCIPVKKQSDLVALAHKDPFTASDAGAVLYVRVKPQKESDDSDLNNPTDGLSMPYSIPETSPTSGQSGVIELAPNDPLANLGDVGGSITYIRKLMGLKQVDLANKLSIGRSALSMIESNDRVPTLSTLSSIAHALGDIPVHAILLKASALANLDDSSSTKVADAIIAMHVKLFKAKQEQSKKSVSVDVPIDCLKN
ncbi:helix-turn-helix domain-containing protein, partial [Spirosoma terrae]